MAISAYYPNVAQLKERGCWQWSPCLGWHKIRLPRTCLNIWPPVYKSCKGNWRVYKHSNFWFSLIGYGTHGMFYGLKPLSGGLEHCLTLVFSAPWGGLHISSFIQPCWQRALLIFPRLLSWKVLDHCLYFPSYYLVGLGHEPPCDSVLTFPLLCCGLFQGRRCLA